MKGSHGPILLRDTEGAPSSLLWKHYPQSSSPTGARSTAITTVIKTMILSNIQIRNLPRITSCMDLISFISSIYRNIWSSYEKCYPSFWTTSHQILWKQRSWYYDYGHSCTFNLTVLMNTLRSSFHVYFSSDQKKWWCPSGWVVYLVHTFDQFDSFMLICGPVSNMTSRHYPTHRVIRQS